MSDIKFGALWALSGLAIGFIAFSVSYWVFENAIPGYKIMLYPGIVTARFFSEEIDFWPKLSIMLTGQYVFYFSVIFLAKKLMNLRKNNGV
jgi:hypothetical protein